MINQVGSVPATALHPKTESKQKAKAAENDDQKTAAMPRDRVEIGKQGTKTNLVYTKTEQKPLNAAEPSALREIASSALDNLRSLVEKLMMKQGGKPHEGILDEIKNLERTILTGSAETTAIEENDPFGVEAVSDRIFKFAVAISGGDKTKLDTLKGAIDEGFAQARKAFGSELPDICNRTYDAIMKKLDDWAAEA